MSLYLQTCVGLLRSIQTENTILQCASYLTIGNNLRFVSLSTFCCCGFLNFGIFYFFLRSIKVNMTDNLQSFLLLSLFFGQSLCFCLGFCLGLSLSFSFLLFLAFLFLLLLLQQLVGGIFQHAVGFELLEEQVVLLVRNLGIQIGLNCISTFVVEKVNSRLQTNITFLYGFA